MARPTTTVTTRVTIEEFADIEHAALCLGWSVSKFVREAALNRAVYVREKNVVVTLGE